MYTLFNQQYRNNLSKDGHPSINIGQYVHLTGLSRKAASAELHRFADPTSPTPILTPSGTGTHLIYIKKR